MDFEEALAMANKLELSLGSDFRFENGEYFLDDIKAIKEGYGNFGEELKDQLNKETDERIKELESERKGISSITGKSGLGRTGTEIQQEIDERQPQQVIIQEDVPFEVHEQQNELPVETPIQQNDDQIDLNESGNNLRIPQ